MTMFRLWTGALLLAIVVACGSAHTLNEAQRGGVRFTSTPPSTAQIGIEYVYDANAEGPPSDVVLYRSILLPSGATLDSLTGEVRWTPAANGKVTFKIAAYLQSNPTITAQQSWYVMVGQDSVSNPGKCAIITGTVFDQNNTPMYGTVYVKRIDLPPALTFSGQLKNGSFAVAVSDSGMYIVKAYGAGFTTEWYLDAADEASATAVTVRCNDSTSVNMIVASQTTATKTITGTVVTAGTNQPIATAKVIAMNTNTRQSYTARIDANGTYTLVLPENETYLLQAVDLTGGHESRYYDNTADATQATLITLTVNRTNIDFFLPAKQTFGNSISGSVVDSASAPLIAYLKLYRIESNPTSQSLVKVAATITDSMGTGAFQFTNIVPGEYVIYAMPYTREHVPGYYKAQDVAVPDWTQATRISVDSASTISGIVISLQKRWGLTGGKIVRGTIRAKIGGFAFGGTPLPEATAILYDASGRVSDYAVSDVNGLYEMNEAPTGTVTLFFHAPGYVSQSNTFQISAGSGPVERSVEVTPSSPTSVDRPIATDLTFTVYPNPATDRLVLSVSAPAQINRSITIYSLLGARLSTHTLTAGATHLTVPLGSLAPGTYIAAFDNNTQALRFRVTR